MGAMLALGACHVGLLSAANETTNAERFAANKWSIPSTGEQLIGNVILALNNGWFLEKEFYSDTASLKTFFNASKVLIAPKESFVNEKGSKSSEWLFFFFKMKPGVTKNVPHEGSMVYYSIKIAAEIADGAISSADVTLWFEESYRVKSLGAAIQLLGAGWIEDKQSEHRPLTDGAYDTDSIYVKKASGQTLEVGLDINGDGKLETANFSIRNGVISQK